MISRRAFLGFIGAGIGCSLAPSFARLGGGAAAAFSGSTLIMGTNFSLKSLDPARQFEATSQMIAHALYDSLVTFDGEDLKTPKPSLATRWRASADGKTYTFALRPNARFASGNLLTAADVKWSLERVVRLKGSPAFFLDGVEEVQAPDAWTVVIRLKEPKPSLVPILSSPSLGILDSTLVIEQGGDAGPEAEKRDKAEPYLNSHSAGGGGFVLAGYVPNQEVLLVKNPTHWRGAPAFDRLVIRDIREPATHQLLLERGDMDLTTGIRQDQAQALGNTHGVVTKSSQVAITFYVAMNQRPEVGGPFANPRVQQAVRYALDYEGIMALAGQGAVRLGGVVPPNFPEALDLRQAIKTDRTRARGLLKEAAIGAIKGRFLYAADRTVGGVQLNILAQKIQADLADVGITLEMNGLPAPTAIQQYVDGQCQIGVWPWRADYPDASDFLPPFLPGGTIANYVGWTAEASLARELAAMGRRAEAERDTGTRVALAREIQRRLADRGPYVALFAPAFPYAFRSDVRGATFNSVWGIDFFTLSRGG